MTKSKPHFTDTPLLPRVFFVPGEGLYIFSKFNLLNTETINPLSPNIHIQILQTDLQTFSSWMSWENLIKDQGIFP